MRGRPKRHKRAHKKALPAIVEILSIDGKGRRILLSYSNVNTVATKTSSKTEIAHEQEYLAVLYTRLDELRATTAARHAEIKRGPTVDNLQAYSEREAFNELYVDRSAE